MCADLPTHVSIPGADLELDLAAGEEIRIEISSKGPPRPNPLRGDLAAAGFAVRHTFTSGDNALTLAYGTRADRFGYNARANRFAATDPLRPERGAHGDRPPQPNSSCDFVK